MTNTVERARELLAKVEDGLPFRLNEVTVPEDEEVIATIRNKEGRPILLPHPEAMSLLVGPRATFEFILGAPEVIRGLIDEIERNAPSGDAKQAKTA